MHSTDNLEDGYLGSGKVLKYSIRKHGRENHIFEILEFLPSRKELGLREQQIVNDALLTNPLCMNLRYGGDGGSSGHSLQTRLKISESRKGQVNNRWNEESRKKISASRLGMTFSDNTRKKISEARTGVAMQQHTKEKISETLSKMSDEIAARQRAHITGRSFYNDGTTVILVKPDDTRLKTGKWKKGKVCISQT